METAGSYTGYIVLVRPCFSTAGLQPRYDRLPVTSGDAALGQTGALFVPRWLLVNVHQGLWRSSDLFTAISAALM